MSDLAIQVADMRVSLEPGQFRPQVLQFTEHDPRPGLTSVVHRCRAITDEPERIGSLRTDRGQVDKRQPATSSGLMLLQETEQDGFRQVRARAILNEARTIEA